MAATQLHPALEPVAELVGTFEGEGTGDYPTIEPFAYRERVTFDHLGTPVLAYQQRTWEPLSGQPMHGESGYLRVTPDGHAEFTIAHVFGITELQEGEVERADDGRTILRLGSSHLAVATTGKQVRYVSRELRVSADGLDYDLWMAYTHVPETHHLAASLQRVG
ncbi:MAG: FABP family protein [Actinomycetota bacterium]